MSDTWRSVPHTLGRALNTYSRIEPSNRWGTPTWEIPAWLHCAYVVSPTGSMEEWLRKFHGLSEYHRSAIQAAYAIGGREAVRALVTDLGV